MLKSIKQGGFTLLELLIVIVIIGILSLIIVPGLSSGRDRANVAKGKDFDASLYHVYSSDAAGIWNMDDGSGSSVADSSSNGNSCVFSGTGQTWTTGQYNGGLQITPAGTFSCGSGTAYDSSEFTIAMWFKPTSIHADAGNGNLNTIAKRANYLTSGWRLGYNGNGRLCFWTTEEGGTITATSGTNLITTSRFYHVAVSYKNNEARLYVDGKFAGSGTGTYVIPTGITLWFNNGTSGTDGVFDNIRYYTASLLTKDIQQLYALGPSRL